MRLVMQEWGRLPSVRKVIYSSPHERTQNDTERFIFVVVCSAADADADILLEMRALNGVIPFNF